MRQGTFSRRSGFMYIAVLSAVSVLVILVFALDYQGRSSSAASRQAEARLYTELAAVNHEGKTLTSLKLQFRSDVEWLESDLPMSVDPEENTNETDWDNFEGIESWTGEDFPRMGSFPPYEETASTLGKELSSPGTEDDDVVAYPGQTRGMLTPDSDDFGFKAPSSRYRMSLVEAFPFAAYAPQGEITITGSGLSWTNPTEAELDDEHRTLDFYSGFPFRVGARGAIEIEDLPYGEAFSIEETPLVKGGGIVYKGYLPYAGDDDGYAARLGERLETLATVANANSYDKTDVVFGTLNVTNIITAIFDPSNATFNNFLTYEQSTRWWFVLIPGFKSRGPALDITLHAPLKPDFGTYSVDDDTYGDDDDIAMTEELEEATNALADIETQLGVALLSPKLGDDLTGTQPLRVKEGDKWAPDFKKFSEIINDRNTAEQKYDAAEDARDAAEDELDKVTGKKGDEAADRRNRSNSNRHKDRANRLEREAKALLTKHGFASLDQVDDWADRDRKGTWVDHEGKSNNLNETYEDLLEDWEDAQKDFAEAKDDAGSMDDGSPAIDDYDPGPTRTRQKELIRARDLDKNGWKGTNLWTMVAKIAKVIAQLVRDIGEAFWNHVFVEIKIFGVTIYLPNPVKLVTFFFADGEFQDQDIQGAPYKFKSDGVPDLVELALVTLKRALVQEVTLVYLGKDGGVGASVPIRIGPSPSDSYQKGDPETEVDTFSIHNTFTVPAGRTFKLLPKGGMAGMTIGADLWLQRGSTMYIGGDLTMENPEEDLKRAHMPKGKIVMEPGSTLVVDGDLIGAGDPIMGSVLLTRRAGRVEPITSAIICTGAVELPHGIRNGFNLMQLSELVSDDVAKVMQDFFDDVVPNVAKVLGPFHGRKPFFAKHGATFTFYFPVIVPNPASSRLSKNINVKLFGLLSPLFAGSLNMTLGENFITCSDWWMFGEDRLPVVPKVLPGAIEAGFAESVTQGENVFGSGRAALEGMVDDNFFADQTRTIVEGEFRGMLDKAENLATNIDDFIVDVAEDTLTNYFTVENITTKVIEFLGKAAASALDPSGAAMIAFEAIAKEVMPEGGGSFVEEMTDAAKAELEGTYGFPSDPGDYMKGIGEQVVEPFVDMAEELVGFANESALRVAATLLVAETPGVLVYGDSINVGGLYAAGMFVAKNDIEMECAYTIGSMVSIEGSITAQEVLYVPQFTRAFIYQPPQTVTDPSGSGVGRLPGYWANSTGLDFGDGKEGDALNYGSGTGDGDWYDVPALDSNTAFRVSGGWGR
jgi:hypothetical protein